MVLLNFYKYLDMNGAKLTLLNRTFKFSKPSDFNDVEDLTVQSLFPEDLETAMKLIIDNFNECLIKNLYVKPTCSSLLKEDLERLQIIFRNYPSSRLNNILNNEPISSIYDINKLQQCCLTFINTINQNLQKHRVFCVSEINHSEKMWDRYAQNHEGIVLKIMPDLERDSKFQRFRKVTYRTQRPPLFNNVLSYLQDSLFGDQNVLIQDMLNNIIYTKTLQWEYEQEYRLAIPILENEVDWNTLLYHANEISELYLGLKMQNEMKNKIVSLAQTINPNIKIFQTLLENNKLAFRQQR